MEDSDAKGYKVEIPDEIVDEALEVVSRPKQEESGEDGAEEVVLEVETEQALERQQPVHSDEEWAEALEKSRQEAKAARERMLRVAADADNIRKRAIKERQEAIKFGQEEILRDLLPIVDNLERTLEHIPVKPEEPSVKALAEGVKMILQQLLDTLKRHNVEAFDSLGQNFDPAKHEALSRKPTSEAEPGVILSEMHRGFMLHERLLRPALVVVACAQDSECDAAASADRPEDAPENHADVPGDDDGEGQDT
ncbi:MAG: nucleotide exchange factor GrpE [Deltaproteobacteria bacterium]|nr:nucleotide exchange factor GrpE [Deltaproteobacteria bacterium]